MRLQLRHDKAATLPFYPPEGRPDADGDVFVYNSGVSLLDATNLNGGGNAIRSTVNTTLAAPADQGVDTFTLTSAVGVVVGERYIVQDVLMRRQEVLLIGLNGTTALIDQPLRFDMLAGDGFLGHKLTVALTTVHTTDIRRRYRASWEYLVDGVTYRHDFFYDVVLLPFDLYITEEDIERFEPEFGENIGNRRGWLKMVEAGKRDVWNDLESYQVKPDLVRDIDTLKDALVYRLLMHWHRHAEGLRTYYAKLYDTTMDDFQASKAWYDSDADLVMDSGLFHGSNYISIGGVQVWVGAAQSNTTPEAHGETREDGLPVAYARVG